VVVCYLFTRFKKKKLDLKPIPQIFPRRFWF
jgi:hypothetical protein